MTEPALTIGSSDTTETLGIQEPTGGRPLTPPIAVFGVAIAAALVLLAAIQYPGGDDLTNTATIDDSSNRPTGAAEVSGILVMAGGRSGTHDTPAAGSITLSSDDGTTYTAEADTTGHSAVEVPSGRYAVTGTSPSYQSGTSDWATNEQVQVGHDGVSGVQVLCHRR